MTTLVLAGRTAVCLVCGHEAPVTGVQSAYLPQAYDVCADTQACLRRRPAVASTP
jgi:hypothetical protein